MMSVSTFLSLISSNSKGACLSDIAKELSNECTNSTGAMVSSHTHGTEFLDGLHVVERTGETIVD